MSVRALGIGMTGGGRKTLRKWAGIGWMPNLDRLFRKGSSGKFQGFVPPLPVAEWATILTGRGPGHTGLTHSMKMVNGTYFLEKTHLSALRAEPFWNTLDRADCRTVLVNLPFPAELLPINGLVVGPEGVFAHRSITTPELSPRKTREESGHLEEPFDFIDRRITGAIQQGLVIRDILGSRSWDLAIVNFSGVDQVLSRFYREIGHMEENGPETPLAGHVLTYFKVLDDAIGQIIEMLDRKGLAIIISGHEFGDLDKCLSINHYLKEIGLLSFRPGRQGMSTLSRYVSPLFRSMGLKRDHLNRFLGTFGAAGLADRLALPFSEDLGIFDWKKTRAFSLGSHAIRINLKGREPMGQVSSGSEYRQTGEEIIANLREVRDPETGNQVISEVRWTKDLYDGPGLSNLPDLVVTGWDPRYALPDFESGRDHNSVFFIPSNRTGSVRREGFSLVMGPGLPQGMPQGEPFSLYHVAPTVLDFLGYDIPEDMEKSPWPNAGKGNPT
jgi:predicted AlkP superfamily phosphohydrolase/phosphomutase